MTETRLVALVKGAASTPEIVPAKAWGRAEHLRYDRMDSTRDGVFVHHTVGGSPTTRAGEEQEMRNLDAVAFARGFNGISYSWVIFPSGRIYVGRGRNHVGAHTLNYNDTSYGVAFAGNYNEERLTDAQVRSFRWLRKRHLDLGGAPCNPHKAVYATECPGTNVLARMPDLKR
jgi:hypothetical protein